MTSFPNTDPNVLFFDDFLGQSLDTSKWALAPRVNNRVGTNEIIVPSALSVDKSILTITANQIDATHWNSGLISSYPGFLFTPPCKIEYCAQVAGGSALWNILWSLDSTFTPGGGFIPEIDILESIGDPTVGFQTIHTALGVQQEVKVTNIGPGFHIYAVNFRTNQIDFLIDDQVTASYIPAPSFVANPFYLIANLAVGGSFPGPITANTPPIAKLLIDWIKVSLI
jgi:beta-glucanase (GH16 family)